MSKKNRKRYQNPKAGTHREAARPSRPSGAGGAGRPASEPRAQRAQGEREGPRSQTAKPQTAKPVGQQRLPQGLFADETLSATIMDGFSNVMARLGEGSGNIMDATEYFITRLTRDYNLMTALYRTHPIVQKLIDIIPEDMCKNWYQINSQTDLAAKRKLTRLERSTKIKSKILEGLKWGRLYGGAAGVIIIDGHDDILDEPLSLDMVMPDSFKGLIILDRWSGVATGLEVVKDYNNPDFGLPEFIPSTMTTLWAAAYRYITVESSASPGGACHTLNGWESSIGARLNWNISLRR